MIDILLFGGDRWFIYVLFLIFCVAAVCKKWLNRGTILLLMVASVVLTLIDSMPHVMLLDSVTRFLFFFLLGFLYKEYCREVDVFLRKYWWAICLIFLVCNVAFVRELAKIGLMMKFVLPITGSAACFVLSQQLETLQLRKGDNVALRYLRYCGKYSMQFYLLSFAFPLIRHGIVNVLHVTNPYIIVSSIMILQLVAIIPIIEITKRIKFLKVPLGY